MNAFGGDSSIIRIGLRGDSRMESAIFSNYKNIREATVKYGNGNIVDGLFKGCSQLTDVHFQGNCPGLIRDGVNLYDGTTSSLVTYVEQTSTGWDGTPGSHSLPQAWPLTGSFRTFRLDSLAFSDGVEKTWINGNKDWAHIEFEVEGKGNHVLEWTYAKDESGYSDPDCGWVSEVVWAPRLETINDYLNCTNVVFSSDAVAWSGVTDLTELARVEYAFDDGDYLPTGLTDKERVGFTLDLSALADGEHTLRLRAVYLAGNVGEACALPVWRDTLPPAVENLTLSPDGWTNGGNLVSATDANGGAATATYDGRGNLLTLTDAEGNVTNYEYDLNGNLLTERLADGTETRYTYDVCGRISSVTSGGERVAYRYDAAGNLLCVGGPEGTTTYTYDCMSRVTSLTEPDGSYTQYRYDLAGRLIEKTDMAGVVSSYEWDGCGNLLLYTDTAGGYTAYYYDKAALTYACLNLIKLAKKRWKTRPIPSLFQFVLDFLTDFFNIYAANPLPA